VTVLVLPDASNFMGQEVQDELYSWSASILTTKAVQSF